jgi:hypothetical protein
MGHLGNLKQEYRELLERLEGGSVSFVAPTEETAKAAFEELLSIYFSESEAKLAAKLPIKPSPIEDVAKVLGLSVEQAKRQLDPLCDKGIVMDLTAKVGDKPPRTYYILAPPVVGFFEFSFMRAHDMFPKKRLAELLEKYLHEDRTFADEVFAGKTVPGRALVKLAACHQPDRRGRAHLGDALLLPSYGRAPRQSLRGASGGLSLFGHRRRVFRPPWLRTGDHKT